MEWSSDESLKWDSDEHSPAVDGNSPPVIDAAGSPDEVNVSEAGPSYSPLVSHFVGMGFSKGMVMKAVQENGVKNSETILETLLTYTVIDNTSAEPRQSPGICSFKSDDEADDDLSDEDSDEDADFTELLPIKDERLSTLVEMGFSTNDASVAINRCGPNATIPELVDSVHAAQVQEQYTSASYDEYKSQSYVDGCLRRKRRQVNGEPKNKRRCSTKGEEQPVCIPKPMIGYGIPFQKMQCTERRLPESATGRPYFYYENVALAPKGVWETISRFLYDIQPEFVDSKYFCAAARKRGYIHNIPIGGRFPLLPIPPKTIQEALPNTKRWWPSWDVRTQFNCLQTCIGSSKLTERIRRELEKDGDAPSQRTKKYVLNECRKWNLVWVGQHKLAALDPSEIEMLLGFPKDHTRGGGISMTERYRSLGNSFQVDTVAYHLSVLKQMFPDGMTVLSLFSGIGGAEVALHRLGVRLKAVVSVEISEGNRNIVKSWWEQTNQKGVLIDLADVQDLDSNILKQFINRFGGFDLVIGGSPCNNLAGSNRHHRDGLEGEHSSLFYHYVRILDLVKCLMGNN